MAHPLRISAGEMKTDVAHDPVENKKMDIPDGWYLPMRRPIPKKHNADNSVVPHSSLGRSSKSFSFPKRHYWRSSPS